MAAGKQAPISTVDLVDPFGDNSGVALYKFDGDATDESGSYDGTASNVTYDTGKFGQCVRNLSPSGYVSLGIHHFNVPKTISFWAKDNMYLQNGQNVVAYETFKLNNTSFSMYACNGATVSGCAVARINLTYSIDLTTFRHICVTINYPTVVIYVDGSVFASGTMSGTVSGSSYDFGAWDVSSHNSSLIGFLDQLRIFNRALSSAEIISLYEEGGDTYVPYVPPQGFFNDGTEVAHYAFDGDATDSTGSYDGTATGVTYAAGKIGQCAVFNKGTSGITTLMDYDVSLPFSFSFFIKTSTKSEQEILMSFANYSNDSVHGFRTRVNANGTIGYYYGASGAWQVVDSTFPITDNIFHHIVFTYVNGTVCLYIDGVLNNSTTQTPMSSLLCRLTICAFTNISVAYYRFDGSIDQLRIFNRAITDEEVTALYNEGQ